MFGQNQGFAVLLVTRLQANLGWFVGWPHHQHHPAQLGLAWTWFNCGGL